MARRQLGQFGQPGLRHHEGSDERRVGGGDVPEVGGDGLGQRQLAGRKHRGVVAERGEQLRRDRSGAGRYGGRHFPASLPPLAQE